MDKLTVQLSQLMAQRTMLGFNFCCHKESNVTNSRKLLTVVRLIQQVSNNCLISAQSPKQILVYLNAKHNYNNDEVVLILSLKLIIDSRLQQYLLPVLLRSDQPNQQTLSLAVARLLGDNLIFKFDFTQSDLFYQTAKPIENLSQAVLFHLYYQQTLNDFLCVNLPEYQNIQEKSRAKNNLSPLSWLTIDVLSDNNVDVAMLTQQFIEQNYLHSPLFDVYITSLNEHEITQLVNQLSVDETLIPYIIHAMALSGYVKFIPFLAKHLQQPVFVLDAYKALRLLLGDKLDTIIPLSVQFNSNNDERKSDLIYYGAKILNAWQQRLPVLDLAFEQEGSDNRLLDGSVLTKPMIDKIILSGSQWHRYVAVLHKQQFCVESYTHHAHALEVR